jgi:hypothetical protein
MFGIEGRTSGGCAVFAFASPAYRNNQRTGSRTMTDTSSTQSADPVDETRAQNKTTVFTALTAAGIDHVTVEYDGSGDSGQIDCIEGWDANNQRIPLPLEPKLQLATDDPRQSITLESAVEDLAWNYLESLYGGWENNDGACGTFVFDVSARTITLEHNERFTDVNTYKHEF